MIVLWPESGVPWDPFTLLLLTFSLVRQLNNFYYYSFTQTQSQATSTLLLCIRSDTMKKKRISLSQRKYVIPSHFKFPWHLSFSLHTGPPLHIHIYRLGLHINFFLRTFYVRIPNFYFRLGTHPSNHITICHSLEWTFDDSSLQSSVK